MIRHCISLGQSRTRATEDTNMQGYLIDPEAKTISAVEYNYSNIAELIDCDLFCHGHSWPNGDVLFVDDNGLLKPQRHFFRVRTRLDGQPLPGKGLVVGPDNATDSDPPGQSIDDLRRTIEWITREQFVAWAKAQTRAAVTINGEAVTFWDEFIASSAPDAA
jgi:hypothetical protein